jgi:hypothetical protein
MKKLSLILLIMSMSTTSIAASCHTEPSEVKYESENDIYQGRQPASVEQQKEEWLEHQDYLDKLDKGVQK